MKESVPGLRHVKEPSTPVNYECASKIPCMVPSFASRGLSCLWCLAPLEMNEGNSLGARVQSAYRLQCRKGPHATFNFKFYPWERLGTHFTGGWVGPRASLDGRKISSPLGYKKQKSYPNKVRGKWPSLPSRNNNLLLLW